MQCDLTQNDVALHSQAHVLFHLAQNFRMNSLAREQPVCAGATWSVRDGLRLAALRFLTAATL
jgi:hypothetical protein